MTNSRPSSARPEMREELPMNYIDLLKRVAILSGQSWCFRRRWRKSN
jgi:hypothetical protein